MFNEIVDLFSLYRLKGNMINKGKGYNKEERNKLHSVSVLWMGESEMAFDTG